MIWLIALILACVALLLVDRHWRALGREAQIIDSKQLWSLQRDRVYDRDELPVVFLGASRTLYGIEPKAWRERNPAHKPIQLAVNGHHPLAVLLDLARDDDFNGLVLVDVDPYALLAQYQGMQQPWVDHYHQRWTPSWRLHRIVLNAWQRISVLANPELALLPSLRHYFEGGRPMGQEATVSSNRSSTIRFDRIDLVGSRAAFEEVAEMKLKFEIPPPDEYLAALADVISAARTIEARGGRVVFWQPPVSGKLLLAEQVQMQRARYWDRFAAQPGIHTLHFADVPAMMHFDLPDLSHVRTEDRVALTEALYDALEARGLLPNPVAPP